MAPERPITLDAPDSAVVSGDPHQLRQVLANLMRNALVHAPGQALIEVSLAQDEQTVTLSVRDHGPGLPAGADPERLFDRFWRAEAGRERGKAGSRPGPRHRRGVVEAHQGQITAQNAPGGGARFIARLPKTHQPDRPVAPDSD